MKFNSEEFNKLKRATVKATVGAIITRKGKILLEKRGEWMKEGGKWCLPGGHIDIGEKAERAIKREIMEETGLKVKNLKFHKYYDEFIPRAKVHAVVLLFTGTVEGKEKIDGDEVTEIGWFSEKEAIKLNLAFEHRKMIKDYFRRER